MILCCGDALIDMIPVDAEGSAYRPVPGGAVFNTAIALGRMGCDVQMISGISRDLFGQLLCDHLAQNHVGTKSLIRSDRPTTLAFVQMQDGQARYQFYDENSAGGLVRPEDMTVPDPAAKALFFGGISLAAEPCAGAYEALLAQRGDHLVMVDPNIRPSFISDPDRYRARLHRFLAAADIVKLSDEDLLWLTGGVDPEALRSLTSGIVVVTRGAQGACGYLPSGAQIEVPALTVEICDTIGAGDTFNAGLLAGLSATQSLSRAAMADLTPTQLRDAMQLGAQMAAITVSRQGANPPWPHELEALRRP